MKEDIQVISAPSILGLKPGGVARLGQRLLDAGLQERLDITNEVITVAAPNHNYSFDRDKETGCLNPLLIHHFSIDLMAQISRQLSDEKISIGGWWRL